MPTIEALSSDSLPAASSKPATEPKSLFDRFGWFYALLREHFFRDDTEGFSIALWPEGLPSKGGRFLEVGCGPGFYARRFARRFSHLQVIGLDRSTVQLQNAERLAGALGNCRFIHGNISDVEMGSFDAILAVRLFTVLRRKDEAVAAMFRLLKPGGRCVIAEPHRSGITDLPLRVLWWFARLENRRAGSEPYREPDRATTFAPREFTQLIDGQPWESVSRWQDRDYQYAICVKQTAQPATLDSHSQDYVI